MSGGGGPPDPLSLIKRFADAEKTLSSEIFLAPYVPGGKLRVKLKGVVYELSVVDRGPLPEQGGFGLFQVTEPGKAKVVEAAKRSQVDAYLNLLPRITLVLVEEFQGYWWGVQANPSDSRFRLAEPVPLRLTERVGSFEQVYARFDGSAFWYHGTNRRRDPSIARKLREEVGKNTIPEEVRISGMTPSELFSYRIVFYDRNPGAAPRNKHRSDVERLRDALEHAGATLDGYWVRQADEDWEQVRARLNHYRTAHGLPPVTDDEIRDAINIVTVRYSIDGHTHAADVRLNDLSVVSSGICLSGRDQDFDLSSLVGVMKEFHTRGYYGEFD